MRKCDCCGKEIEEGYLVYDSYVSCEKCMHELYTKEEYEIEYEKGNIFWTTWYTEEV